MHNCPQSNTSGNNSNAQVGNQFHYDRLNGGPANVYGGPSQISDMYPHTKFQFTPRGSPGADVEVVGGIHPSDPNAYPGTNWPMGSDNADFKPNVRQFNRDIRSGKLPFGTIPIYYDPPWFVITQVGF